MVYGVWTPRYESLSASSARCCRSRGIQKNDVEMTLLIFFCTSTVYIDIPYRYNGSIYGSIVYDWIIMRYNFNPQTARVIRINDLSL